MHLLHNDSGRLPYMMMHRVKRATVLTAAAALLLTAAGCAPSGSTEPVSMVGTWTGEFTYPLANGTTATVTERIVIETQDGRNIWGYQESAGSDQQDALVGQLGIGGNTFVLTETDGFFSGVVDADRMAVRYIELGDTNTSYEVELTRKGVAEE